MAFHTGNATLDSLLCDLLEEDGDDDDVEDEENESVDEDDDEVEDEDVLESAER